MPAAVAAPGASPFAIEFGQPATTGKPRSRGLGLDLNIPLLGGTAREAIFGGSGEFRSDAGMNLLTAGDLLIGWTTEKIENERELSRLTQRLYRQVLVSAGDRHLYRIWNYVPRINALTDGTENYHAFCQGRSLAFEETLGRAFPQVLSAASAVGTGDGHLSLIFVAGATRPRHVENPEQMPAYRYPAEHGPRSPSFSRATVASVAGRRFTFISGTSAIKGHTTVAPGSLPEQLDCTLDNLRLISRESGAGDLLQTQDVQERHFKIYLRHARDFPATQKYLDRQLLRPTDLVTYLQADVCRAALSVEIEATLIG